MEEGLRSVYVQALTRIREHNAAGARIRVTYRDRTFLHIPPVRTSLVLQDGWSVDEFYDEFNEALMILFQSNDELEPEDLYILLDMTGPRLAGGDRGSVKHLIPTCLLSTNGVFIIPSNVSLMCGWTCIGIHMFKHSFRKDTEIVPGICKVLSPGTMNVASQRSWKNWALAGRVPTLLLFLPLLKEIM